MRAAPVRTATVEGAAATKQQDEQQDNENEWHVRSIPASTADGVFTPALAPECDVLTNVGPRLPAERRGGRRVIVDDFHAKVARVNELHD